MPALVAEEPLMLEPTDGPLLPVCFEQKLLSPS
jgi:hypothetical protein